MNPEVEQSFARSRPEQELWRGQKEALYAIQQAREQGIDEGYAHMATGTGKTKVAARDAERYTSENGGGRVLYLCHNGEILRQARKEFSEIFDEDVSHGNVFEGEFEDQADIVYATFQTMTGPLGDGKKYEAFDPKEFKYRVIDETHHGAAPTYKEVIDYFEPGFSLGLTPAPNRRDSQPIEEIVGPKLFSLPLERAIAEGYVTPVNYKILTDHVKTLPQLKAEGIKLDINKIDEQIFVRKNDQEIVDSIKEELSEIEDPRTVVFCSNIDVAEQFAELYPDKAVPIHSKLGKKEVRARIKQFRSGEIHMAVTVGMFDEGIDLPEINSVVFLRQTESERIWLQQLGRGLRIAEGKKEVKVLDYVASFGRLNRIHRLIGDVSNRRNNVIHPRSRASSSFVSRDKKAPFAFNMSEEAQRCVDIIEVARNKAKPKPPKPEAPDSPGVLDIKRRFGIGDTEKQRTDDEFYNLSELEWEQIVRKVQLGDTDLQTRTLEHFYPTILRLAQNYPEQNGLTLEDYFMAGCAGYWQGIAEGRPANSQTILSVQHFNTQGRTEIVNLIKDNTLIAKSITNLTPSMSAKKFVDPISREDRDVSELNLIDSETSVHEEAVEDLQDEAISRMLSMLVSRDKKVIKMRYGLETGKPATLDEISRDIGVTRERVRQIEHSSFRYLKRLPESNALRDFYINPSLKIVRNWELPNEGLGYYRHQDHTLDGAELLRQREIMKQKIISVADQIKGPFITSKKTLELRYQRHEIPEIHYSNSFGNVVHDLLKGGHKTPSKIIQGLEELTQTKNVVEYRDVRIALARMSEAGFVEYKDRAVSLLGILGGENFKKVVDSLQRAEPKRTYLSLLASDRT